MTRYEGRVMRGPLIIAFGVVLLHAACAGHYGIFRDELYFVVCGQHLTWGYVDQPPGAAVLARLAWWLSGDGDSVFRFRVIASFIHAGSVLITGALARRLGGLGFAATLASLCVAVAPVQLAQGHLVTMNVIEIFFWVLTAFFTVRAVQEDPRWFLASGVALGLSILTKYSAVFFAVTLLVGLLFSSFASLRTKWLWLGIGTAVLIASPSALWQWQHELPFLELLKNGRAYKNVALSPLDVIKGVLLDQGPLALLISLASFAAWKRPAARVLIIACTSLLVVLTFSGAKPYYLAPALPPLFALGAVVLESKLRHRVARIAIASTIVLEAAPGFPLAMPLLPVDRLVAWQHTLGMQSGSLEKLEAADVPQHFADQFGWRERTEAIAALWKPVAREHAVIYARNYGMASALTLYGRPLGLPRVISGHNQFFLWGIPDDTRTVIAIGGDREGYEKAFESVTELGTTPSIEHGMPYESNLTVYLLEGARFAPHVLLERARHYE